MGNIISYTEEYGGYSFDEMPLNEVDSLIFCELAYLYYDAFVVDIPFTVTFETIMKSRAKMTLTKQTLRPKSNAKLMSAIFKGKRFRNIALGYYVNDYDPEEEKQFCAIVFKISENCYYVAFRGTDTTFVGWKEDFNMAFMSEVPAQKEAVKYLKSIIERYPDGKFVVGGHSKGGNLAVYASAFQEKAYREKIVAVYNHDGPGFRNDVLSLENFEEISEIVNKTVPQTSIIGMLLQEHGKYRTVQSNSVGLLQHDSFFWTVEGRSFVYLEETDSFSKFTNTTINEWLNSIDDETRKTVVDALYSGIASTKSFTFKTFRDNFKENAEATVNAVKDADPQVKEMLQKTFKELIELSRSEMKNIFNQKVLKLKSRQERHQI